MLKKVLAFVPVVMIISAGHLCSQETGNTQQDTPAVNYDKDGYDVNGYDSEGYDREGYNKDGVDRRGYDRSGVYHEPVQKNPDERDKVENPTVPPPGKESYDAGTTPQHEVK